MKNDMVLDYLDNILKRLNEGESVEYGEIKVIWKLVSTKYRELLVHIKTHNLEMNGDVIEFYDKINEFVDCMIKYHKKIFPSKTLTYKPSPIPMSIPTTQPQLFEPVPWYLNPAFKPKITCDGQSNTYNYTTALNGMDKLNPSTTVSTVNGVND